jgi:hypothetical protein
MRSASDRIWSSITTIHQTNHLPDHPLQEEPLHQENQPDSNSSKRIDANLQTSRLLQQGIHDRQEVSDDWRVDGYSQLITDRICDGWTCHFVTILFSQLPGPQKAIMHRMTDEVLRIYNTLLTRVHRNPKGMATEDLMLLVGAFDLPVYKRDRSSAPAVFCNGGLHYHALLLLPPWSRLKGSLTEHFEAKSDMYAESSGSARVHVKPVSKNHDYLVDYVFKTVLKGRLSYDDAVLVLPRAKSELTGSVPTRCLLHQ